MSQLHAETAMERADSAENEVRYLEWQLTKCRAGIAKYASYIMGVVSDVDKLESEVDRLTKERDLAIRVAWRWRSGHVPDAEAARDLANAIGVDVGVIRKAVGPGKKS